jgi:hypothetical protein
MPPSRCRFYRLKRFASLFRVAPFAPLLPSRFFPSLLRVASPRRCFASLLRVAASRRFFASLRPRCNFASRLRVASSRRRVASLLRVVALRRFFAASCRCLVSLPRVAASRRCIASLFASLLPRCNFASRLRVALSRRCVTSPRLVASSCRSPASLLRCFASLLRVAASRRFSRVASSALQFCVAASRRFVASPRRVAPSCPVTVCTVTSKSDGGNVFYSRLLQGITLSLPFLLCSSLGASSWPRVGREIHAAPAGTLSARSTQHRWGLPA